MLLLSLGASAWIAILCPTACAVRLRLVLFDLEYGSVGASCPVALGSRLASVSGPESGGGAAAVWACSPVASSLPLTLRGWFCAASSFCASVGCRCLLGMRIMFVSAAVRTRSLGCIAILYASAIFRMPRVSTAPLVRSLWFSAPVAGVSECRAYAILYKALTCFFLTLLLPNRLIRSCSLSTWVPSADITSFKCLTPSVSRGSSVRVVMAEATLPAACSTALTILTKSVASIARDCWVVFCMMSSSLWWAALSWRRRRKQPAALPSESCFIPAVASTCCCSRCLLMVP